MPKRVWIIIAIIAFILGVTGIVGVTIFTLPGKIVDGVYAGPHHLGGLTVEKARAKLVELTSPMPAEFVITVSGHQEKMRLGDLVNGYDLDATLGQAQTFGRGPGLMLSLRQQWRLRKQPVTLPLFPRIKGAAMDELYQKLLKLYAKASQPASLKVVGDSVTIIPSQDGLTIDDEDLWKVVFDALSQQRYQADIQIKKVPAWPSTETLQSYGIKEKIAEFNTTFNPAVVGRTHNLTLAAQSLDNQLVAPGQEFSFNGVVGPAGAEDGYQEAIVIANGEFTNGIGGGVCQVSSTLYGAVLRANLPIVERHNHYLIVTYVPLGLDATVGYPTHDFRFSNNQNNHLLIKAEIRGDQLIVRLFGVRDPEVKVVIEAQTLETYPAPTRLVVDPKMKPGEEEVIQAGSIGYKAVAYRKVYRNGQLLSSEKLGDDVYQPSIRVLRVPAKR